MLNPFKTTATLLTTLIACALPLAIAPTAAAEVTSRSTPPSELDTETDAATESHYEKAREELPANLYMLYRIVERIARANDLDNHPWRVVVADDSLINAYATEVNLVIVHYGLLDQMAGDVSALACVVGHEMAHHTEQHIAIRTSRSADWQEEFRNSQSREFQERISNLARTHESEADRIGYEYSVTAGFDASGCLRGLEMLSRLPGTLRDSETHPAVPRRIEAIEELMQEKPPEVLQASGRLGLTTSEPLSYEMVEEQSWLRINSARGGSFVEDWNRLFPNDVIDPNFEPPEEEEPEASEESERAPNMP